MEFGGSLDECAGLLNHRAAGQRQEKRRSREAKQENGAREAKHRVLCGATGKGKTM